MFVDTAKVELRAGKGGDGAVSFRHEIYIPKGGPDGGNGGKGGSIIFKADKDTNTLLKFRFNPILKAEDGKNGSGQRAAGRSGKDLIIKVPVGTIVYRINPIVDMTAVSSASDNGQIAKEPLSSGGTEPGKASISTGKSVETDLLDASQGRTVPGDSTNDILPERILLADLTEDGQEAIIAKGGDGGFGNAHFKSSTRQTPKIAEIGEPGEAFTAELELKLLADVGLVGLPSAGKSTFLASVTNATPEIADYPFTTLTPNLGIATIDDHDLLIADIPGLIEGASEGKGLGHAFLRHIDRTAVLLHLVDVYSNDAGETYEIIRHELEKYSDLKERPEIVALTKVEGLDPEIVEMQKQSILKKNPSAQIFAISSLARLGTTPLLRALHAQIEDTPTKEATPDATEDGLRSVPVIKLSDEVYANTWTVEKGTDGIFHVSGGKIEKFARRTDLSNYASVNRLRDIMKKLGIRAELTTQGAEPDSIIEIAGKQFTLVEQFDN